MKNLMVGFILGMAVSVSAYTIPDWVKVDPVLREAILRIDDNMKSGGMPYYQPMPYTPGDEHVIEICVPEGAFETSGNTTMEIK